jgi:hypothetical protein
MSMENDVNRRTERRCLDLLASELFLGENVEVMGIVQIGKLFTRQRLVTAVATGVGALLGAAAVTKALGATFGGTGAVPIGAVIAGAMAVTLQPPAFCLILTSRRLLLVPLHRGRVVNRVVTAVPHGRVYVGPLQRRALTYAIDVTFDGTTQRFRWGRLQRGHRSTTAGLQRIATPAAQLPSVPPVRPNAPRIRLTTAPGPHCPACGVAVPAGDRSCGQCGAAQPLRADTAGPARRWAQRYFTGPHRAKWIAATVATVLLVVSGISFGVVRLRDALTADPAVAVRTYFQALADRDADRARAMIPAATSHRTGSQPEADQIEQEMLAGRTLHDAGYTPPQLVQVTVVEPGHDHATVTARFDGPGGFQSVEFRMSRRGIGGLFGWEITNGLLPLYLPSGGYADDALLVAGNPVPATLTQLRQVFPGSYLVKLRDHPIHLAAPVTVWAGYAAPHPLVLRPRPEVRAATEPQVRAYLDKCAASTSLWPAHCPFAGPISVQATDVHWKITAFPVLKFQLDNDGNGRVDSTGGRALVTGRFDLPGGLPFSYDMDFEVTGVVLLRDGKVVFDPMR